MMIILIILVVLSAVLYIKEMYKRKLLNLPPEYPNKWPIIGNSHICIGNGSKHLMDVSNKLGQFAIENGGVIHGYFTGCLTFVVADPDDSLTIFNTCLEKGFLYEIGKRWLGDGLITNNYNITKWKRHRKIINRAFNQQVLDGFIDTFNNTSKKLVEVWADKVGEGPFEHLSNLEDMALDIMYKTTLGLKENEVDNVSDQTHKDAIRSMLELLASRFCKPWTFIKFLYYFTSMKNKEDEILTVLHKLSNEVLDIKRNALNNKKNTSNTSRFKSFIDLMLELPEEDKLVDQEIKEEVDTMIVAGSDTTATMLTFALMLLGSHQDIQDQVYKELIEVVGDTKDVEKHDLSRLVLLEAVLMETMRLYPVMPVIPRYVTKNVKLKNYTMPAGSMCVLMVYCMHRNPELWGPDAGEFRPQRWIPNPPPAARSFAGFSIGKRGCLGKAYAMMSMKTTLSHLLRRYRVSADVKKLELQIDILLKPATGSEIALTRRN